MSLREQTFHRVAGHLNEAAESLKKALEELKTSEYWANTTEYDDIHALMKRTKQLQNDFLLS